MITFEQKKWTAESGWKDFGENKTQGVPTIVFVFGGSSLVNQSQHFQDVKSFYPNSPILSCSTAGEILDTQVSDNTLCVTAVSFENTQIKTFEASISQADESLSVGEELSGKIPTENLTHVMVFSDGLKVNGTALVKGLLSKLPPDVSVTGGLVGDGDAFKHTFVGLDKAAEEGKVVVLGFYGNGLKVGYGSLGGWDPFGPDRVITKSKNNVLYELDGQSALDLYKSYLGDKAAGLPGTGLLFPLALKIKNEKGEDIEVVRTLLAVDEAEKSMTFAGDMPEGVSAKLMKANFERLIDGASGAATHSIQNLKGGNAQLAILVSCVGRKLVLKERIEEEVEAVREVVGPNAAICGFYSYGELCPFGPTEKQCQLHNQTMTITTFEES